MTVRSLHLVDLENLAGDPRASERDALAAYVDYLAADCARRRRLPAMNPGLANHGWAWSCRAVHCARGHGSPISSARARCSGVRGSTRRAPRGGQRRPHLRGRRPGRPRSGSKSRWCPDRRTQSRVAPSGFRRELPSDRSRLTADHASCVDDRLDGCRRRSGSATSTIDVYAALVRRRPSGLPELRAIAARASTHVASVRDRSGRDRRRTRRNSGSVARRSSLTHPADTASWRSMRCSRRSRRRSETVALLSQARDTLCGHG